ncbi:hypothetical protein LL946_04810 [Knoellia locipacati]|uniref:hypothetical protein n=1 Tax=Knoellia locipacati TaxID=882824 RepID=UPI00384BFF7C
MKLQRTAYAERALRAAAHVLEVEPTQFAPARMSKYAHWFEDPQHGSVVAVVTPGEKPTVTDEVLAFGLAWQQNRDLLLVVPDDMVVEAIARIGWLETEVRVFAFDGAEGEVPRPVRSPGRFAILERLAELPERVPRRAALKTGHASWLDNIHTHEVGLVGHDRGGYFSWHHEGLQVLQAHETKSGLRIRAGVQYKTPQPGRDVFDKTFTNPPTVGEVAVINAKVALAIEDGGSLTSKMREHKLQATLKGQPEVLGLTDLWREFPAWRGLLTSSMPPFGRPGYIDFLGADATGVLHVVETKIGHDPKVVLQALDYAIWVRANDSAIRERLKAEGHILPTPNGHPPAGGTPAPIHLVLGSLGSGPAFNAYLAGQIEALAGDCRVSIYLTAEPTADELSLTKVSARDLWEPSALVAKPVVGPRWPGELTTELGRHSGERADPLPSQ